MKVVADTNIFLAVSLNEPESDQIVKLTAGVSVLAPEILPHEVGNALSAMVKRGKLTRSEALEAKESVDRIPVRLVTVDVYRSLKLAIEHDIYAYDAYFLQSAQMFPCPLLTLDRRMQQVAARLGIEVLESSS
jgi:predicted nucleic acid-binding protein